MLSLLAENLWAGVVEVPSDGVQRLIVKGLDANVVITQQPQAKTIRINGVEDNLSSGLYIVERKGSALEVHLNERPTKTEWKTQLGAKKSHRTIEISGFP